MKYAGLLTGTPLYNNSLSNVVLSKDQKLDNEETAGGVVAKQFQDRINYSIYKSDKGKLPVLVVVDDALLVELVVRLVDVVLEVDVRVVVVVDVRVVVVVVVRLVELVDDVLVDEVVVLVELVDDVLVVERVDDVVRLVELVEDVVVVELVDDVLRVELVDEVVLLELVEVLVASIQSIVLENFIRNSTYSYLSK